MKSWLTIAASFFPELGAAVVGLIMAACANGGSGESGASNTSKLTVLAGEAGVVSTVSGYGNCTDPLR
jgi:hypothetical protein